MAMIAKIDKILTREVLEQDYKELQSMRKIADKYNISRETVRYYIHQYGLVYNKLKIFNCDHSFFQEETEQSFYLAGFIAADGCVKVRKNTYELSIALSIKDKYFLEKIKNILKADVAVKDYLVKNSKRNPKWNDSWKSEFCITSKQIFNDLAKFNIVPRKSLIYTFPEWLIGHSLISHFMRGYFDGDGSFFINTKENKADQIYTGVRGTREFLTVYRNILEQKCNLKHRENEVRLNNGIGTLEYGGNGIISSIAKFLYKDATIFLPRKKIVIEHILKQ